MHRFAPIAFIFALVIGSLMTARAEQPASPDPPIDVWLDVDVATGLVRRDVDDGLAMIQAFHSPELRVRGVSVVHGNAPLDLALPIAREIVDAFGPVGLAVHPGAAEASQLGESTPAVEALAVALRESPMTILALGPLTNIGSLLQLHPDLAPRIERIVIVAGRRPGQVFRAGTKTPRPLQDFNFERDPDAAAVLLDSDVELWLAPWEVSSHVWIREADLDRLGEGSAAARYVSEKSRAWLAFWKAWFGVDGFNPFDTLAVGALTHPHLIESFEGRARIEEAPDDLIVETRAARAATASPSGSSGTEASPSAASDPVPLKPYLHVTDEPGGRRVRYFFLPSPEFQPLLLDRLNAPPAP